MDISYAKSKKSYRKIWLTILILENWRCLVKFFTHKVTFLDVHRLLYNLTILIPCDCPLIKLYVDFLFKVILLEYQADPHRGQHLKVREHVRVQRRRRTTLAGVKIPHMIVFFFFSFRTLEVQLCGTGLYFWSHHKPHEFEFRAGVCLPSNFWCSYLPQERVGGEKGYEIGRLVGEE
jgi:hypothetical protein